MAMLDEDVEGIEENNMWRIIRRCMSTETFVAFFEEYKTKKVVDRDRSWAHAERPFGMKSAVMMGRRGSAS